MSAEAIQVDPDRRIGPYDVVERIEFGRLAGVLRARHVELDFPVCLKLLKPHGTLGDKKAQLARFQHEARVSAEVDHVHVVRAFHVGRAGDVYFLAFEDLTGNTLQELLDAAGANGGRRPQNCQWLWGESFTNTQPPEVCRLIHEAALGLAHLHELEIVHRDVKPDNLWITDDGHVKVMDFGLARDALAYLDLSYDRALHADATDFVGSPEYMSLEQGLDADLVTAASDVYSLGCTFYHALTGNVPFPAATPAKQMLLHATQHPERPSRLNPRVPVQLDDIVAGMLAKRVEDRYRNCQAVAEALEPFIDPAQSIGRETKTPQLLEFLRWIREDAAVYSRLDKSRAAEAHREPVQLYALDGRRLDADEDAGWLEDDLERLAEAASGRAADWQLGPIEARKIICATSFSRQSDVAVRQAASLARGHDVQLVIVHVREEAPDSNPTENLYYGMDTPGSDAMRTMLRDLVREDSDLCCEYRFLAGNPADAILRLAKQENADLIVMAGNPFGGVAEAVTRKAPCTVLIVKP